MSNRPIFEICVDSVESAVAAQQGGAERVELCDNLVEGGTTPSAGTIALARKHLDIDLNVIIRPRGGDFCYSDIEFKIMQYDIERAKQLGANGVVIGLLLEDGTIDKARTGTLVELARPLSVTFHRAFDMTRDPFEALEDLVRLKIDRVLSSGQEYSVLEGLELITDLVQAARERIVVMPGGGITERNINKIVNQSGVKEIHVVGLVSVESPMHYRNPRVFMGGELRLPEFSRMVTAANRVEALVRAVR
ncbi:MAG: copper homeostasis protein CutC [Anaerolineae bacterium]|nr:copper homeostasis protein CutC [Anaerolineae bacterium]